MSVTKLWQAQGVKWPDFLVLVDLFVTTRLQNVTFGRSVGNLTATQGQTSSSA